MSCVGPSRTRVRRSNGSVTVMRHLALVACLFTACAPALSAPATGAPSVTQGASVGFASSPPPTAPATFSPAPSPSPGDATPQPLTRMELKVIGALATLGVTGRRAQHPYQDSASIWAELGTGMHFFVHVAPTSALVGERSFSILDERQLEGIRVAHARYEGGSTHHRFDCSGINYKVIGALPPGYTDMYA